MAGIEQERELGKIIKQYLLFKIIIFLAMFVLFEFYGAKFLAIVLAVLEINIVLTISRTISVSRSSILSYLGKKSLEIYLLHGPIMVAIRWLLIRIGLPKVGIATGIFFGALILSIIASYIIHSNRITEFVCFGDYKKNQV